MAGFHPNNLILKPNTPTFALQPLLPRLPVADLRASVEGYLESIQPLLTEEEQRRLNGLAKDFLKADGVGERLHKLLLARAEECNARPWNSKEGAHWLEEMWDALAYFSGRDPLPVNVNVFGTLYDAKPAEAPFARFASITHSLGAMYQAIVSQTFQPESLGRNGQLPLCMHQFTRVFATCRKPDEAMDSLQIFPHQRHVIVHSRNQYFTFDLIKEDGSLLSPAEVQLQLRRIDALSSVDVPAHSMSVLTYDGRTEWAKARKRLLLRPVNRASLELVERALFSIVLSDFEPKTPTEVQTYSCHHNGSGIWADKAITMMFFKNGVVSFNGEHSASDALTPCRVFKEMSAYMNTHPMNTDAPVDGSKLTTPVPLRWTLDRQLDAAVTAGAARGQQLVKSMKLQCLTFMDYGKDYIRSKSLGPDSYFQMALQLAYFRDQHSLTATYESATMRTFLRGRTETIRPLSTASAKWCHAMDDSKVDAAEKAALFRAAVQAHFGFSSRCLVGQGVDRCMMGLQVVARFMQEDVPMFKDEAFQRGFVFKLSTSQMPFDTADYPGFGPPYPYSYGCCYVCHLPDRLLATVTCSTEASEKDAARFVGTLEQALRDIRTMLDSESKL